MATKANLVAVGSYLRRLREQHGMSVTKVAGVLDTSEAQIRKIERGSVDTRGSMLVNYCELVKGDLGDVAQLMLSEQATAEHGVRLAERWLAGPGQQGGKLNEVQYEAGRYEVALNGKE
jgi:transcriptional regulator with XRE-family HTH domain